MLCLNGEIVQDLAREKQWRIGKRLGAGSFGHVFLASDDIKKEVEDDTPYVIKIGMEPKAGIEIEAEIYNTLWDKFNKRNNNLNHRYFGVPQLFGSGAKYHRDTKFSFIIIQRLRRLDCTSEDNTFSIGDVSIEVLNILENIHSLGYIHRDIKLDNIMCGYKSEDRNKLYLVDYGAAHTYLKPDGSHVDEALSYFRGTQSFASRDALSGVLSRRSDIENLAFNIIYWLGGQLPWKNLPYESAFELKVYTMGDISFIYLLIRDCYEEKVTPSGICNFMEKVAGLEDQNEPDYYEFKNLIQAELDKNEPIWKYPVKNDLRGVWSQILLRLFTVNFSLGIPTLSAALTNCKNYVYSFLG